MNVVVGYDGSPHARRALERVGQLADATWSVTVVAAADIGAATPRGVVPIDSVKAEQARKSLEDAERFLVERGVKVNLVEAHGEAAEAIGTEAERAGADLVVVGTRGLNTVERALLGSTSSKLVHHARCDVLVVR